MNNRCVESQLANELKKAPNTNLWAVGIYPRMNFIIHPRPKRNVGLTEVS